MFRVKNREFVGVDAFSAIPVNKWPFVPSEPTGLCRYFRKVPDLALSLYKAELNIWIFDIFAFDNIYFNYDFFSKCHNI